MTKKGPWIEDDGKVGGSRAIFVSRRARLCRAGQLDIEGGEGN